MPTPLRALAAATALALAVTGCTGDEPAGDPLADTRRSVCATADGDGPRVGLAYDVGGRGDHGLNDGAYAGLVAAVEQVDATCVETEAAPDASDADRTDRLRRLAEEGYDPVVAVGDGYVDATAALAGEHPGTSFAVIGVEQGAGAPPGNVAHIHFADDEGSHLVGLAAALQSSSRKVGVVGLEPLPRDAVAGFRSGVRAADRDVEVRVRRARAPRGLPGAARALLREGADVVYDVSGLPRSGVPAVVAAADGSRVVGFGVDLARELPAALHDVVLTSMVRRAEPATLAVVRAVDGDAPIVGERVLGVAEEGVGWAASGRLPAGVTRALETAAEQLETAGVGPGQDGAG